MKHFLTILFFVITTSFFAQKFNTKKGFIAEGFDVVSYFDNKAEKGDNDFITEFKGVKFKFSSKENLLKFKNTPEKYIPQYGGFCAYAMGEKAERVGVDPKTFEIRDGKLYLFYNSWGSNTFKRWIEEDVEKLQQQADKNWQKLINN